ncbi:MAG: aminoacyl-tRNA hydrolase [Oscillospiraceae bacterium]|nr:aminoacyl-tRNA hydrolase [Oscillospiraceae bacterium]
MTIANNFYKFDVNEIIILSKSSAGGHNGLKSIIYSTGSDNFCRIKIGVGAKPSSDYDLAKWVLSNFSQAENNILNETYKTCCFCCKTYCERQNRPSYE